MRITPYLGRPDNIIALPPPDRGSAPPARGESAKGLIGGGMAVVRRLNVKRQYELGYDMLLPVEADVLVGFYSGSFGLGPYVYVDPTAVNVLPFDVANCGLRTYAPHTWVTGAGTLTRSATGGPTGIAQTGMLTWTGLSVSDSLRPNFSNRTAPVNVKAEAVSTSLWVKASATVTLSFSLTGYNTAGGVVSSTPAVSASIGTSWTLVTVSAAAGAAAIASAVHLLPRLTLPSSGLPTSVSIAAAQLEYSPASTDWRPGQGSPRVLIKEPIGYDTPALGYSAHVLSMAETL